MVVTLCFYRKKTEYQFVFWLMWENPLLFFCFNFKFAKFKLFREENQTHQYQALILIILLHVIWLLLDLSFRCVCFFLIIFFFCFTINIRLKFLLLVMTSSHSNSYYNKPTKATNPVQWVYSEIITCFMNLFHLIIKFILNWMVNSNIMCEMIKK